MVNFAQNTTFLFQLKFLFGSRLYCGFLIYPAARVGRGYIVGLYIYKAKVEDITLWNEPSEFNLKIEP